uniref:5-methyltetrahydropteroyltriglutamate--homocysteine S-methyltransferase n=1 Tax=Tetradesmus obliquus TaxID=3088 RepID=A0A383VYE6_TETOB|eukprot:jgi/Sobl393_1/13138/SZX70497.1
MAQISTGTFGFPRIGPKREIKAALEAYWSGKLSQPELLSISAEVQAADWQLQASAGITRIGIDGTLYDQVLDTTLALGLAPVRFANFSGLELYFAMARGASGVGALDMSKFFDTNYHYLVPELEGDFSCKSPNFTPLLEKVTRAQALLGKSRAIPMLIGPVTFVLLSKRDLALPEAVSRLLPAYGQLLRQLQQLGCPEVQLHEPSLATDAGAAAREVYESTYAQLAAVGCPIDLVTYYDDLGEAYPWAVNLPVAAVSLDFCGVPGSAAGNATLDLIRAHGFPASKRLGAGLIDGRSVWADDLAAAAAVLGELSTAHGITSISVQPSTTLQHLPYSTAGEAGHLPAELLPKLAFAVQKLQALADLATPGKVQPAGPEAARVWGQPPDGAAAAKAGSLPGVDAALLARSESYEVRRPKQPEFHAFPTSTIGSFPQTAEVRRLRTLLRSGKLSRPEYERLVDQQVAFAVGVQEAAGLDVLVHGEPERTDMVEYFGVQLGGLAFTLQGWVQSYGSRYVRPPIITGDVSFTQPMTVREFTVAQQLTAKPVKGMLTGPVTILNWSFPRKDISRAAQAAQLGLALRREVDALQGAGCKIIQVDEPALREGLPLKQQRWAGYLGWAVDAFRLSTAVAAPGVQVVTHLCYSDFQDIMPAVDAMDADVLTIENSRSGDAMVSALAASGYAKDLGPGVYDVHSPQVPDVDWLVEKIQGFVDSGVLKGRPQHIWVNPDCGLKTRRWEEVIPSLRNMVAAAAIMRGRLAGNAAAVPLLAAALGRRRLQSGGRALAHRRAEFDRRWLHGGWEGCGEVAGGGCEDCDNDGGVQLWGVRVNRLSLLIDLEV